MSPNKRCIECQVDKPATPENFEYFGKVGLRRTCRACRNARKRVAVRRPRRVVPAVARFLALVDKGDADSCWIWQGSTNGKAGYGHFVDGDGKQWLAHRFSYAHFIAPIPDGLEVLHTCDVRLCVNPGHLFVGTQADNITDCVNKGRKYRKLAAEQVLEMRRERLEVGTTYAQMATRYGVTAGCIHHAVTGRTWAHL